MNTAYSDFCSAIDQISVWDTNTNMPPHMNPKTPPGVSNVAYPGPEVEEAISTTILESQCQLPFSVRVVQNTFETVESIVDV